MCPLVLLNNSIAVCVYHRKSKCDINSLKSYLLVKEDPELYFSKIDTEKWKMSKGLCNSSIIMATKRNLFTVLTLCSHSGRRLNYSRFIELGIIFQFEINKCHMRSLLSNPLMVLWQSLSDRCEYKRALQPLSGDNEFTEKLRTDEVL